MQAELAFEVPSIRAELTHEFARRLIRSSFHEFILTQLAATFAVCVAATFAYATKAYLAAHFDSFSLFDVHQTILSVRLPYGLLRSLYLFLVVGGITLMREPLIMISFTTVKRCLSHFGETKETHGHSTYNAWDRTDVVQFLWLKRHGKSYMVLDSSLLIVLAQTCAAATVAAFLHQQFASNWLSMALYCFGFLALEHVFRLLRVRMLLRSVGMKLFYRESALNAAALAFSLLLLGSWWG
jgi:hypothetical protein